MDLNNRQKYLSICFACSCISNTSSFVFSNWSVNSRHPDTLLFNDHITPNAGFRLACRSPLCRVIIAFCFRVAALSGNAALALSPSGIAPELNRIQLSAICRNGQSGKVID